MRPVAASNAGAILRLPEREPWFPDDKGLPPFACPPTRGFANKLLNAGAYPGK
jgi:hypothetical protein